MSCAHASDTFILGLSRSSLSLVLSSVSLLSLISDIDCFFVVAMLDGVDVAVVALVN